MIPPLAGAMAPPVAGAKIAHCPGGGYGVPVLRSTITLDGIGNALGALFGVYVMVAVSLLIIPAVVAVFAPSLGKPLVRFVTWTFFIFPVKLLVGFGKALLATRPPKGK